MNIFSRKNKLEDELFNMKFTAKTLLRNAKKCEKNQAVQKAKLKKAIEQGNMEGAKIYAQNVIREKTQALNYLQLASRMDAVAARVQTAISMGQLKQNMNGVVKGMDTVMASMNVEKISHTMDQFEKHFEDMDVRAAYMEGAMNNGTSLSTPADQVEDLIQMVADENGLKIAGQLDSAGLVGTELPSAAVQEKKSQDELSMRLAALRKTPFATISVSDLSPAAPFSVGLSYSLETQQVEGAAMVNFYLRLRDNIYAEWKSEYLDYRRLKSVLQKQQSQEKRAGLLDHSVTPISRITQSYASFRAASTASNDEMQTLLLTPASASATHNFEELFDLECDKVESAYRRHLSHFADQLALLRDQYRRDAPEATQNSLKHSLMELHRLLHLLYNFALLNYTGFVKILKKLDKKKASPSSSERRSYFMKRLQSYSFAEATQCQVLFRQIEAMFADLFCDGNRSVAVATLMSKKEDVVYWEHIYMGIKIGSCLILLVWIGWDSMVVPSFKSEREEHLIDLTRTRAYPVYRGIGGVLLLHWLVGVSLYVWRAARINYRYIFELDPRRSQQYTQVFSDATNMSIVFLVNLLLYYKVVNGYFPEAILHRGYYPLGLVLYTVYFYAIRAWDKQRGLWRTVLEIVGSPFFPVTFFHTFVGDYLTSTVKVNQDLCWSVCFFATSEFLEKDIVPNAAQGLVAISAADGGCAKNFYYVEIVVPLVCALPLWWRFLQNLRRIYDTETWWPHLPNAFKYALAQVVALFGVFHPFYSSQYVAVHVRAFQVAWIVLFTLSSLYTWVWDVTMDWGLGRPQFKLLGDRQMFARKWVYYLAIVSDLFLRFAWTLTLIPPGSSKSLPLYFQPFTMVLELVRRTFWSFFRLENEHLRNTQGFRRVDFIPLHYDHGVGDAAMDALVNKDQQDEPLEPIDGRVFLAKILLIMFVVLGLSVAAILIEQ